MQLIQSEVDRYDRFQWLGKDATTGASSDTTEPRIFLCSEVKSSLTISAYGTTLSEGLGIKDFVTPLLNLLQGKIAPDARFNKVGNQAHYHLHITDSIGQNILLMPSLLSMSRNWWSPEGGFPCHFHMAELWPQI